MVCVVRYSAKVDSYWADEEIPRFYETWRLLFSKMPGVRSCPEPPESFHLHLGLPSCLISRYCKYHHWDARITLYRTLQWWSKTTQEFAKQARKTREAEMYASVQSAFTAPICHLHCTKQIMAPGLTENHGRWRLISTHSWPRHLAEANNYLLIYFWFINDTVNSKDIRW